VPPEIRDGHIVLLCRYLSWSKELKLPVAYFGNGARARTHTHKMKNVNSKRHIYFQRLALFNTDGAGFSNTGLPCNQTAVRKSCAQKDAPTLTKWPEDVPSSTHIGSDDVISQFLPDVALLSSVAIFNRTTGHVEKCDDICGNASCASRITGGSRPNEAWFPVIPSY